MIQICNQNDIYRPIHTLTSTYRSCPILSVNLVRGHASNVIKNIVWLWLPNAIEMGKLHNTPNIYRIRSIRVAKNTQSRTETQHCQTTCFSFIQETKPWQRIVHDEVDMSIKWRMSVWMHPKCSKDSLEMKTIWPFTVWPVFSKFLSAYHFRQIQTPLIFVTSDKRGMHGTMTW